ncbi:uncharacterized protein LOC106765429 [Vigna radiata var. radiata]|uniref:Uncharacterized protein LOC106765429 n=1 Tax=Vigna radiata var. radiata TaxID=3916 RepID=A0A1S3UHM6_VIGRR|nr:uncharacterized protein LOC106765429 [Vigna radiata var. radiata]
MQRNSTTELEEGEAFYCYEDEDDDNIDLDSLSYIDERIQHVLGDFQKEFEGGIFPERLGAKFGEYGSFLPTYERSPRLRSGPKAPEKPNSSQNIPSNIHTTAAIYNSRAPPNTTPSTRLGTASPIVLPSRDTGVPSEKNTGISSNRVTGKCSLKEDFANKAEKLTKQRTPQIKVKSDNLAKKNAAIYSGLGLDGSPSSSTENSQKEVEDSPHVSQEMPEESCTSIIQVMTSFTIPGGVLISPLHDSLLNLIRKGKALGDSRPMSSLNGHQEHYSMSTDESDSLVRDSHLLKKRKLTAVDQSEKHHMNGNCYENDMTSHTKKRLANRTPDRKDFLSNGLRCTPLSSSICDAGETAEVAGKAIEVSKEVNKNGVECRMDSIEVVKEVSLESISDQDFDKVVKRNTGRSFGKKVLEHKMEMSQDNNSADPKNSRNCNTSAISKRFNSDEMKREVDQDTKKFETNQTKVKSASKNNLKGEQGPIKVMADAKKGVIGSSDRAMVNDRKSTGIGVTSSKIEMHKMKLMGNKVRDCDRGSLKRKKLQLKLDGIDPTDGPPLNKDTVNADLYHAKKSANEVKVKEKPSGNKVVYQLSAVPCVKDAPGTFPVAENKPTSEMVLSAAAAPQLIEEDWVCCDSCQKWRLLPMGLKPEQLPEKWLCSMLYWLPGMNRCNISEEETTKSLYALYQIPISEGQNNMQSHVTEPKIGVKSIDTLQLFHVDKKSSSDVMLDRGNKKHGIHEKAKPGLNIDRHQLSNTVKNGQESNVKNRSLNDMNQRSANSNRMKKSNSQNLNRLNNFKEDKKALKAKEYQINGGDKQVRLKRKMEDNQHGSGTHKKSKIEVVGNADKHLKHGMDYKKVGLNSRNDLPTKASGENTTRYDDYCSSDDNKFVVPVKKGDGAQFSSDDGSLDATNSRQSGSVKERKMSDWRDNEKHNETLYMEGDMHRVKNSNVNKKQKYTVLNTEAKPVIESDDEFIKESKMKRAFLPASRDKMSTGTEVKSDINMARQPRKHKKNVASYQALDCFDPSGGDLGSGKFSLAATSSSSKVSGSREARTKLEKAIGSPVESVTSSPLRTSNIEKCIYAAGLDTSEKDDARKGGLSIKNLDSREKKLSVKKERVSLDKHLARVNCGSGSRHEEKMNKSNQENALSWQKSGRLTSLRVKQKVRTSGSEVSRDKMKVSVSDNDFSKNGVSYESAVHPNNHTSGTETSHDDKHVFLKSKPNIDNLSKQNPPRHWSDETGKQTEPTQNDFGNPILKREPLHLGSRTAPKSQKGDMFIGHPVHASGNGDVPRLVRNAVDVSCKAGDDHSLGSLVPDRQLSGSSPVTTNSSQTASGILEEATKLKDSADHYKNSGFEFESNETYFKAALKFLHGASLIEKSHSEISKQGEMNQMEIYAATAKLFESCAHKYERRQEMAAAALAYKCMEVVYMRLVYNKHSTINRDRDELKSILKMVSQGESPSSSASDIDNLNNVGAVDRTTLTRGYSTLAANNQVISAQNRPNIVRLLDFTQDINFAMEASIKCKSTFMAANLNMDEARNRDCITSIRKVIDFSFQDVDELVHLVMIATKAMTRAGLGGVRD